MRDNYVPVGQLLYDEMYPGWVKATFRASITKNAAQINTRFLSRLQARLVHSLTHHLVRRLTFRRTPRDWRRR